MAGVLTRQSGWMNQFGERLDPPLSSEGETVCPTTGAKYRLQNGEVTCLPK